MLTSISHTVALAQAPDNILDVRNFKNVITGFNTDIEHDGVVYHVQTEDKGLDSPLILSLVYSGGAILASKRSRYEDLIAAGFNEELLAERLKRQHRLICAAINAGRLEDLKRMGAKAEQSSGVDAEAVPSLIESKEIELVTLADEPREEWKEEPPLESAAETTEVEAVAELPVEDDVTAEVVTPAPVRRSRKNADAYSVHDPRRQSPPNESGLGFTILDEDEFEAGRHYTIRILVEEKTGKKQKSLAGVGVSVKILGTAFRPQMYSVKTERDGVAIISTTMPKFTSGRAAVLIRAVVKGQPMEVRRVIHPAE